jgi:hypothetical protein
VGATGGGATGAGAVGTGAGRDGVAAGGGVGLGGAVGVVEGPGVKGMGGGGSGAAGGAGRTSSGIAAGSVGGVGLFGGSRGGSFGLSAGGRGGLSGRGSGATGGGVTEGWAATGTVAPMVAPVKVSRTRQAARVDRTQLFRKNDPTIHLPPGLGKPYRVRPGARSLRAERGFAARGSSPPGGGILSGSRGTITRRDLVTVRVFCYSSLMRVQAGSPADGPVPPSEHG